MIKLDPNKITIDKNGLISYPCVSFKVELVLIWAKARAERRFHVLSDKERKEEIIKEFESEWPKFNKL